MNPDDQFKPVPNKLPPPGQELGRPPGKPEFDPHAGREVAPGREHGDKPESMISTLVFVGVDRGGDFEDTIQSLVKAAEVMGLSYITASIASFDLDQHSDMLLNIMDEIGPSIEDEPE